MWSRPFKVCILALSALGCASVFAFERPFPPGTKRGVMTPANHPQIILDGKNRHLAPGARIWNQDNLIEMPASLRGSELPVRFTEDARGDIDRVWILTPEEARRRASP